MILPFKKVYFLRFRFGGGATMQCFQPCLACHDLGIPSEVVGFEELPAKIKEIRDSAVFVFKDRLSQKLIDDLRSNNNILARYAGDGPIDLHTTYHNLIKNMNGVIVGTDPFQKILHGLNGIKAKVIPSNHDYFLDSSNHESERKGFKLYFGGSRDPTGLSQGDLGLTDDLVYSEGYLNSFNYLLKNMKNSKSPEQLEYVLNYISKRKCPELLAQIDSPTAPTRFSCHYAIRAPFFIKSNNDHTKVQYEQWVTKTGGKVSTAAASGANIVTSLDPSVRVLIDESYPFSIDTETEEFAENYNEICREMIIKAQESFGKKLWLDGLKILEDVKIRTTTHNITKEYLKFFVELYENQ